MCVHMCVHICSCLCTWGPMTPREQLMSHSPMVCFRQSLLLGPKTHLFPPAHSQPRNYRRRSVYISVSLDFGEPAEALTPP